MADEKAMSKAKSIFNSICKMLENQELKFGRNDEDLSAEFIMASDDLDILFNIIVDPESMIITTISPLPFMIPAEKITELALAASYLNYTIIKDGSFDVDIFGGFIGFRVTSSYRDSIISETLLKYIMDVTLATVNGFNKKLSLLASGEISLEEYLKEPRD